MRAWDRPPPEPPIRGCSFAALAAAVRPAVALALDSHALNQHGDAESEAGWRGQRPVSALSLLVRPEKISATAPSGAGRELGAFAHLDAMASSGGTVGAQPGATSLRSAQLWRPTG